MKTAIKNSSMRLALIWGMILLSLVFIGITYRIFFDETVDYSGIAVLLASATLFISALVYGKVQQKKEELNQVNINKNN